MILYAS